jgi:hypothetical protein
MSHTGHSAAQEKANLAKRTTAMTASGKRVLAAHVSPRVALTLFATESIGSTLTGYGTRIRTCRVSTGKLLWACACGMSPLS